MICGAGLLAAAVLAACGPSAEPTNTVEISEAWAPATPPGASVGAVYLVVSARSAETLIEAHTPLAASVEVHETIHEDGMAKMRRADSTLIEPGQALRLAPGGKHLMLLGLHSPLEANTQFPLTLRFAGAGERAVQVQVKDAHIDDAHH